MEDENFNIKIINDYENILKEILRTTIKEQMEQNNFYIKSKKIDEIVEKINVSFLVIALILPGENILCVIYFIALIIFKKIKMNYQEKIHNDLNNKFNKTKRDASDVIDAIELLKEYIREKELSTEELIKIVENLYLKYGIYLNPIIEEIERKEKINVRLKFNKENYDNNLKRERKI